MQTNLPQFPYRKTFYLRPIVATTYFQWDSSRADDIAFKLDELFFVEIYFEETLSFQCFIVLYISPLLNIRFFIFELKFEANFQFSIKKYRVLLERKE